MRSEIQEILPGDYITIGTLGFQAKETSDGLNRMWVLDEGEKVYIHDALVLALIHAFSPDEEYVVRFFRDEVEL